MKKTVLFSVMLAGAATCLAGSSTVKSSNAIGLMQVSDDSKEYLLVAVPWLDYGTGAADINVAELIKTANLTAGDKLYVSDGSSGYDVYELTNNEWQPTVKASIAANGTVSEGSSAAAANCTVQRGDAVWLKRSAKNAFYIFGQKPATDAVTVNLGSGLNLVASPSANGLALSSFSTGCILGDEIIINGNSGEDAHYYFRAPTAGGDACWTKVQKSGIRKSYVAATETIPAGTGFWYKTTGTGRSITF